MLTTVKLITGSVKLGRLSCRCFILLSSKYNSNTNTNTNTQNIHIFTQVEVQHGPRVTVASVQEAEEGGDIAVECRAEVPNQFLLVLISSYPRILIS